MSDLAGPELIRQAMEETREHGQASCVTTRLGDAVRIYAMDGAEDGDVHGAAKHGDGWYANGWHMSGSFLFEDQDSHGLDLIPAKRSGTGWAVYYEHTSEEYGTTQQWYTSRERHNAVDFVTCVGGKLIAGPIRVDWVEGQSDD